MENRGNLHHNKNNPPDNGEENYVPGKNHDTKDADNKKIRVPGNISEIPIGHIHIFY
jgi:hypothetical protein